MTASGNSSSKTPKQKFNFSRSDTASFFDLLEKTLIRLKPGQHLYRQNTAALGLYYIVKGTIRMVKAGKSGVPYLAHESGPGSLIGLSALIKEKRHSYTAIAKGSVQVLFINKQEFMEFLSANPGSSNYLLINLCKQLDETEQVVSQRRDAAEKKVAGALVILFGKAPAAGEGFCVSAAQLAGITGFATAEVLDILSDLKDRKLVTLRREEVLTANTDDLKKLYSQKSSNKPIKK